jgi:hypothetical protein
MKTVLVGLLALGGVFAAVPRATAQDTPPATEQAKAVETLVNKAAALIDKEGKVAFTEFRKKDSEWFHGDTYLFAYDMKANVLLNPAFPQREGTNVTGQGAPVCLYRSYQQCVENARVGCVANPAIDPLPTVPGSTVFMLASLCITARGMAEQTRLIESNELSWSTTMGVF